MAGNMKMLRQLQEKVAQMQADLGQQVVMGTAGGGAVKAKVNGHQELLAIEISPEVVDPGDVTMLQDLVLAAVNQAMGSSRELAAREMGQLTAGLGLPPGLI